MGLLPDGRGDDRGPRGDQPLRPGRQDPGDLSLQDLRLHHPLDRAGPICSSHGHQRPPVRPVRGGERLDPQLRRRVAVAGRRAVRHGTGRGPVRKKGDKSHGVNCPHFLCLTPGVHFTTCHESIMYSVPGYPPDTPQLCMVSPDTQPGYTAGYCSHDRRSALAFFASSGKFSIALSLNRIVYLRFLYSPMEEHISPSSGDLEGELTQDAT